MDRPRLVDGVVLHPPSAAGEAWILQSGTSRFFRVSPAFAQVAGRLDGRADAAQLAGELGAPWTPDLVRRVVVQLAKQRLLDSGARRRRSSRLRFAPPMTIQFSVLDPSRVLGRARPLIALLMRRWPLTLLMLVAPLGILALAVQGRSVLTALGSPLPLRAYAAVVLAMIATTAVHEFAHGAVLTYHGGRPSRIGIMLFYLTPAFFCDVSDGWRLPRPRQRVQVALAGVLAQAFVAGAAALVSMVAAPGTLRSTLIVFSVAAYLTAVVNLAPFIKLDGYIALMSHLDEPGLRAKAMTDARRAAARVLFGGRYEQQLAHLAWAVPFGVACLVFPWLIVGQAAMLWVASLSRLGAVGSGAVALGLLTVAWVCARGLWRLVREGLAAGADRRRVVAGLGAALAVAAAVLLGTTVPFGVQGGYFMTEAGEVRVVLSDGAELDSLPDMAPATFHDAGVVLRPTTGTGTVDLTTAADVVGPLGAILGVDSDLQVPLGSTYAANPDHAFAPSSSIGIVRLHGPDVTLARWLVLTLLAPAF